MQYQSNISEIKQVLKFEHYFMFDYQIFCIPEYPSEKCIIGCFLPFHVILNDGNGLISEFECNLN